MAETQKITSVLLTISFDGSILEVKAGKSLDQANDPESWLTLSNKEVNKTAIVVEILKKLTVALEDGGVGIDLLIDGRIIRKGPSFASVTAPIGSKKVDGTDQRPLVDLNRASIEDIQTLPGVGPALANAIVLGRTYQAVDDLLKISGIGEAKMVEIRPLVRV
jgi:DNA uptake protein ComE-like DNA-binding protein